MATSSEKSVLDAVRDHYAERARSGTSCCSPDEGFYASSEIDFMPADVANFSLGCGNAVGGAALQPGETVLDLGSGGGLECFIAAREVGEAGRVIGVDMTPDMLARARNAAARMGFDQVEFREGAIEALPVESGSVDVIISNCVINLSPDKPAVFREMFRVLKPGGRLAISDVVAQEAVQDAYRADLALWSACASGALSIDEWVRGLEAAGFDKVRLDERAEDGSTLEPLPGNRLFSGLIRAVKPVSSHTKI